MKSKKIVYILLAILTFSIFAPLGQVSANEVNREDIYQEGRDISTLTDEELEIYTDDLAKELEFYFSEVGYLDENNNYHVTNPELLEEKAKINESAKALYEASRQQKMVQPYGIKEGVSCVVGDQYGWVLDLMDGEYLDAIAAQLANGAYNAAAKILKEALLLVSKKAGNAVVPVFTVADWAVSLYKCRGSF
jgi:hypothetical protein